MSVPLDSGIIFSKTIKQDWVPVDANLQFGKLTRNIIKDSRLSFGGHIWGFGIAFLEFFHFDFFLFLHNLNYFLLNSTVFSSARIVLLKYFRLVRSSMLFILVNLENDSFLHFVNATLYKLALRNYYTRSDWENLINTYESSMTNSFAFNGEFRGDLVFIVKVSLCYGFLICNYLIFYVFSIMFLLLKHIIYILNSNYKVLTESHQRHFWFADTVLFITEFSRLHVEFYVLRFNKLCSKLCSKLKSVTNFLANSKGTVEAGRREEPLAQDRTLSVNLIISNLLLLVTLLGFFILKFLRTCWSLSLITFYKKWPVFYLLFCINSHKLGFKMDYMSSQTLYNLFSVSIISNSTLFKRISEKFLKLGLIGSPLELEHGLPMVLSFTFIEKSLPNELLFNFFKLKFFVEHYSKFHFAGSRLFNIVISHIFAFKELFG
jgi:hypothetical protein